MEKLFLSLLSSAILLLFLAVTPIAVLAQENDGTVSAKLQNGGSYELFWPLTAGKTMDDPLYFLKLWKEDIGGLFIFNVAKKADYGVMLSTKRILEAEKLLKEEKEDLAVKTLDKALAQLTVARGKFSKVTKTGNDFQLVKTNLLNKLSNLDVFLPKLASLGKADSGNKGEQILKITKQFLGDFE